jgi:hypothetical protein
MVTILIFAISLLLGVACAYIITTAVVGDGGPEWAWWTVAAVTYFIVGSGLAFCGTPTRNGTRIGTRIGTIEHEASSIAGADFFNFCDPHHNDAAQFQAKNSWRSVFGGKRVSKVQRKASGKNEPFWPAALIAFALSLTAVWLGLIGFGLMQLIDLL